MSFEFRAKANRISFKCGRYNSNCSAFARPDRAAQQNREKIVLQPDDSFLPAVAVDRLWIRRRYP